MNCRALCLLTQQLLSARLKKIKKGQDGGAGSHPSPSCAVRNSKYMFHTTHQKPERAAHTQRRDDTNVCFLSAEKASERLGKLLLC